jgi:ATP-dependent Clp protease ATP-binding subunit ClpX
VELEFTDDALRAIAAKAAERNTGARGLRGIMERIMGKLMYEIPGDEEIYRVVITGECVKGNAEPEILRDREQRKKSQIGDTIILQ